MALYFLFENPDYIDVTIGNTGVNQQSFISDDGGNEQNINTVRQGDPNLKPSSRSHKNSIDVDNKKDNPAEISNNSNRYGKKKLDTRIDAVEINNLKSYFYQAKVIYLSL